MQHHADTPHLSALRPSHPTDTDTDTYGAHHPVMIASCSMDGTVRLYDPYGDVIQVLSIEKMFFSFVTVMPSTEYPLLVRKHTKAIALAEHAVDIEDY